MILNFRFWIEAQENQTDERIAFEVSFRQSKI
jgi:hypothetical protein